MTRKLDNYQDLQDAFSRGYVPKLRNAIGHNTYTISDGRIRTFDLSTDETSSQFYEHIAALEKIQNCALWTVNRLSFDTSSLRTLGVVSGGWVLDGTPAEPDLMLFQLQPFHYLDFNATWLSDVELVADGNHLTTRYGGDYPIEGPIDPEMVPLLERIRKDGSLKCHVFAVMPCIHRGEHLCYEWPDGEFCVTKKVIERVLPVRWT